MLRGLFVCLIGLTVGVSALPGASNAASPPTAAKSAESAKPTRGRLLRVGPTRKLKRPSHAAGLARNGDTIEIDAGTYRDCAVWRASRITIRGVGGLAHVRDVACQGKAIWVIYGKTTTIENIRFSHARVPGRNGAGIRHHGGTLLVRNSHFHNTQMGILTQNKRHTNLVVIGSKFEQNGDCPTFCGHGIYAGLSGTLKVMNSTFSGHRFGHHIKSRAANNQIVGNRIRDGVDGTASFAIDLPNGGTALIRQNYIEKGPASDNSTTMIAIGNEGIKNPSRGIVVERNVFQSRNPRLKTFVWSRGVPVRMVSNTFQGDANPLRLTEAKGRRRR